MTIKQFEPHLKKFDQYALMKENREYKEFLDMHKVLEEIGFQIDKRLEAFRDATIALAALQHKIMTAFQIGYLAVKDEAIGTEEEQELLFLEIAEYLYLVAAGIDTFVAGHPIKAITEGGADDEEQ